MKTKAKTPTPFEQAVEAVKSGKLNTPSVSYGGNPIPYFKYQLSVHKFNLSIMSSGMSCRGIKLKDLKAYYGLTGKTAADCLEQYNSIMDKFLNTPAA